MSSQTVKRIDLPSGGWWELETRPRWKHVREWSHNRAGRHRGPSDALYDEQDLVERVLVSLTPGWSFPEPVSIEGLAERDERDVIAAMEMLRREIVTLLDGCSPNLQAEELFACLVTGRVPHEFAEAHLMALTGWSWQALQETPADVVERMSIYLAVKQTRETGGGLDISQEQHER